MLDFVFEQLSARVERVKETAVSTCVAPTEDAIHELRVSIRRLTEAIRSLEPWVKSKPAGKLRERLRPVMKAAGETRNLDIALELAPTAPEALAPLRTKAVHALLEELLRLDLDKLHPPCEPDPDLPAPREMAASILRDLIPKYWVAGDNVTDLHQFRLATKHLRYTIELFAPAYGRGAQSKLTVLKDIQSHLGKFHDCQAVRELEPIKQDPQLDQQLATRQQAQREKFQEVWEAVRKRRDTWVRYFCGPLR